MSSVVPENIQALILDMDGVIWKGDAPIGDLPKTFERIRARGLKFVFATNNSTKTPAEYCQKLDGLGVSVAPEQIVTSAMGAAFLIAQHHPQGTKVFVVGENGLRVALQDKGFQVLGVEDAPQAETVVVSIDREINFQKMVEATLLVQAGRPFYTTNTDRTFPTPRGEIPGSGSWISVVVSATGAQPLVAGKPFPYMMELALERLNVAKENALVVGDRLETDIAAGQALGCPVALVLSGVSTRAEAAEWNPNPALVAESLWDLIK